MFSRKLCRTHYMAVLLDERAEAGATCSVTGCARVLFASGLCTPHYHRWRRHGDPGEAEIRRKPSRPCVVKACSNNAKTRADLCPKHAHYKKLYRDADGAIVTRPACAKCSEPTVAGQRSRDYCKDHYVEFVKLLIVEGKIKGRRAANGYVYHQLFKTRLAEHRVVMESILGRPLLSVEEPHHRNGVRHDNRPRNLELWSTSQPSGQRVTDKVAWAVELLELYAPELLAKQPTQLRLA